MSYYEHDAISQSYLKALLYGGNESKQEDSKSLSFGSLLDTLVTQPIKEFVNKYYIIANKPSDTMTNIAHTTVELMNSEGVGLLDAMTKAIELHNYIGNKAWDIDRKIEKVIADAGSYIDALVANQGKKFIDRKDYEHASMLASHITQVINKINVGNEHILYQKDIYFNVVHTPFDDDTTYVYPAKAMLDAVIINYADKIIIPIDVKYCSDKFETSAKRYRYDIQASFYTTALQAEYPDYTITPFIFVVGYDDYKVEVYTVTDFDMYVGEHGAKRIYAETYTALHTIKNEIDIFGWRDGVKLHHDITLGLNKEEFTKQLNLWN